MGVKAEHRFYRYNREYFDREAQRNPESRETEFLSLCGRIEDLEAALKAEREKTIRAMNCIKRLRSYLTAARIQRTEARAETREKHKWMMAWLKKFQERDQAWRYVSRIVRDLCTPDAVARWREEEKWRERQENG